MSPKPRIIDRNSELSRQKYKQISNTSNNTSQNKDLSKQFKVRKSRINKEISNISLKQTTSNLIDYTIEAMNVDCFQTKISLNNTNNLVFIQFENVLGYDEQGYFGLQPDFITNKQYNGIYSFKRSLFLEGSLFSILLYSKEFQRIIKLNFSLQYPQLLKEFLQERKLKVNCGFQILNYKIELFVVDITQVLTSLQILTTDLLILIQPSQILSKQQSHNCANSTIPYYEFPGQRFFLPFQEKIHPNNCRLLALPQLSMESLLKLDEQSKGFVQINYVIEQFTLALQSESYFIKFLNRSQNRMKLLDFSTYFRSQKQKLQRQLFFIVTLKIQEKKQDPFKIKKKELIQRMIEKFDHSRQAEYYLNDLMYRNKEIFKKMRNYKQENVNNLYNLQKELSQQLIRYNYCEMFIDTTYYLAY